MSDVQKTQLAQMIEEHDKAVAWFEDHFNDANEETKAAAIRAYSEMLEKIGPLYAEVHNV